MSSIERRLRKLEDAAALTSGVAEGGEEHQHLREMWEMQMEWIAIDLIRGVEPNFTLDAGGAFLTLDGRFALSPGCVDMRNLMGPDTQRIQEAVPPERWERFLDTDQDAADALGRLLARLEAADVPDTYREPNHKWHDLGEVNDKLGNHDLGSVFADAEEREQTRRLTWTLVHGPDARAMLSELTRRRDAFIAEEGEGVRS